VIEYLKDPNRPTGIFAGTDAVAIAILQAAPGMGIRVPEDLSAVGFNDQPEAATSTPPLTTMSGPRRLLAQTAVETVFAAGQGKFDSFQTKILTCRLVVRRSTAPPKER
jgi:LacI family transcriptional regulator